ncbi:AraC family transcriptional regulator [Pedobacter sp. BS3]|nr:AraC family transcriptional regulator [Pedobacter sp. BS3]
MDWVLFLIVFTVANKCLLFPLFWFKRNNSTANKLLALLVLLSAIPVLSNYIIYTGGLLKFPHTIFIYQMFGNLVGPVFFFYCMEMLGKPFVFNKSKLLHLLPSLFPVIFWIDFLMLNDTDQVAFAQNYLHSSNSDWRTLVASLTPALFALPYFLSASLAVYKYSFAVKDVFASTSNLKIKYIKEFVTLMLVELGVLFILYTIVPIYMVEMIWLPLLGNVFYFYVIYKSYNYSVIFSEDDYKAYLRFYQPLNDYITDKSRKQTGWVLPENKAIEYLSQLQQGFENEKWYTDPELNLKTLSEKSGIPAHCISRIINERFGKNFFDYVNSHRVEELKAKLLDPAYHPIKIEEIAYICGFNSKAAFHRAFKKYVGISPTEYRQEQATTVVMA